MLRPYIDGYRGQRQCDAAHPDVDGDSSGAEAGGGGRALAWLLHRSPAVLPIPGTSSVAHLEDNVAAAGIALSGSEYAALESAVG